MLQIADQQMAAFSSLADTAFARRFIIYLRKSAPALSVRTTSGAHIVETAPANALESCIRVAMANARSFGLTAETAIAAFVAFSFVLGPRFFEAPDVRALLTDEAVPNGAVMHHLAASLTPARVAELQASGAAALWPD